jgi:hypothetical protein
MSAPVTPFYAPITTRAEQLFLLPFRSVREGAIFTHNAIVVAASNALAFFTLDINKEARELANKDRNVDPLLGIYGAVRRVINPNTQLETREEGHALLSYIVKENLWDKADGYSKDENFFKRHVASRVLFAVATVAQVIARLAEGILGLAAAALSIVTVGKFSKVNQFAVDNLGITKVIPDAFQGVRRTFFPVQA